jgi:hypothetical protein
VPASEIERGLFSQQDAVPRPTEWNRHPSEQQPTAYVPEFAVVVDDAQAPTAAVFKRSTIIEEPDGSVFMQALPEVML